MPSVSVHEISVLWSMHERAIIYDLQTVDSYTEQSHDSRRRLTAL